MLNYKNKTHKIQPIYSDNGKIVGTIENGVLKKNIYKSRHILRYPPAICWDESIIQQAEALGVIETVINDKEEGKTYSAPLSSFRIKGFSVNRKAGPQIGLLISHWHVEPQEGDEQLHFDF